MFNRILVPLDGSPLREAAISLAIGMAKTHDAEILLLRVAEGEASPLETLVGYEWIGADKRVAEEEAESAAYLQHVVDTHSDAGVPLNMIIGRGKIERAIPKIAKEENADLIVMGTRGRAGLENIVMGSVAEAVIAHAHCPVMLVRAKM